MVANEAWSRVFPEANVHHDFVFLGSLSPCLVVEEETAQNCGKETLLFRSYVDSGGGVQGID